MKRRLIGIASSIALLSMMAVPAGAQFIVETQAQTTVEAVLQEFPEPHAGGSFGDPEPGRWTPNGQFERLSLTDPTMGYGAKRGYQLCAGRAGHPVHSTL